MDLLIDFINGKEIVVIVALFISEVIAFLFIVIIFFKINKINKINKEFFKGKNGKDLEGLIVKNIKDIKSLDRDIQELYTISNQINSLTLSSIHKVGVVRFNPFKDIGGDQSFSVALLDGKHSGLIISSLHTREGTRVYIKPITKGKSEKYPLTEEENKAIKLAVKKKSN